MTRLSSEARRWLLAVAALFLAGIGLSMLWGIGWGLTFVGLGVAVVILLYDPDRSLPQ